MAFGTAFNDSVNAWTKEILLSKVPALNCLPSSSWRIKATSSSMRITHGAALRTSSVNTSLPGDVPSASLAATS